MRHDYYLKAPGDASSGNIGRDQTILRYCTYQIQHPKDVFSELGPHTATESTLENDDEDEKKALFE